VEGIWGWLPHRVSALGRRVRGRPLGVSATRRQAAGERMELKKQGREHGEREHQMRGQDLAAGAVRKGSRARLPARRGEQGGRALGVQAARGGAATARVDVRRDLEALKMGMANNATMTRTDEIAYVDAAIDVYCPRYVRLTGTMA
jgi:hypothetical protein